jgi:hypothetical protein
MAMLSRGCRKVAKMIIDKLKLKVKKATWQKATGREGRAS